MAFVITGSAMAAENVFEPGLNINEVGQALEYTGLGHSGTVNVGATGSIKTGSISSYNNFTITAKDITVSKADGTGVQTALDSKGYTFDINFHNQFNVNITDKGHGIVANAPYATIDIDGNRTGSLSVIADENAVSLSRRDDYINDKEEFVHHVQNNKIDIHDVVDVYIESKGEDEGGGLDRGHAIYAHNDYGEISIDASGYLEVTSVEGKKAVWANGSGSIITLNSSDTIINGDVRAEATANIATINLYGDEISLNPYTDVRAAGIENNENGYKSVLNIGNDKTKKINISGASVAGVVARLNGATVNIEGSELNITDSARGLWAQNNSYNGSYNYEYDKNNSATINVSEKTKTIINLSKDTGIGIGAYSNGTVNVAGDLYVTANEAFNLRAGFLNINIGENRSEKIVQIDGDTVFTCDAYPVDSVVNINLANENSWIKGNIYISNDNDKSTEQDLKVTGMSLGISNNAYWATQTGDSVDNFVNNLTLSNHGTIKHNNSGNITVTNLKGSGDVVFDAASGDLHIDGGTGSLNLTMANQTADDLNTVDQLTTVAEKLGVSVAAKETVTAKVVMAEGKVKGETTGVVSYKTEAKEGYYHGYIAEEDVTEKLNTTNASVNNTLNVALMAWRAENNDMNKRLGELRNANGEHGVWVRMVNGESEYKDVENEYKTYQLGYDEKLSVDPSWTVGAAVSYTEADTTADKASGENKHKGFSVYGSKLNDDGSFVDLIAKVARIEHDFNVAGDKGDWSSNGYSLSAEYGKRLEQGNGLWIEPQVELTYGKISSAECELAGRNVTLEDMESLVGRVGFSLGKDIKQGNIYARASYLYDFEGETTTKFSDGKDTRSFEQDLGGGWWEVGVGANINLSKATYIYADVEKTFGGEVDTNWQWNLGVRYSF